MDRSLQARLECDPLLQKAVEWFLELRSDSVSGERIADWQQWLSEDAAHRQAFQRIESFWRLIDEASAHWPTEAEVAGDSYSGSESITAWRARSVPAAGPASEARLAGRGRRSGLGAVVAGMALAAAAVVLILAYWPILIVRVEGGSRVVVDTTVGETRTITLPDGSVVSAGGETSLVATLLGHSRTVMLSHGEAFFHVAKDRSRPFTVHAGSTAVTAVGTEFDVRRTLGFVVVAVAEGVVRVAAPLQGNESTPAPGRLSAGQQLTLEPFHVPPKLSSVDPTWVAGWREGRLQYVDEPLDSVVADLARYSTRRITIEDPNVARLQVTGVVFVQNVDGWLSSLEATFPVRVERQADGSVAIEQR